MHNMFSWSIQLNFGFNAMLRNKVGGNILFEEDTCGGCFKDSMYELRSIL